MGSTGVDYRSEQKQAALVTSQALSNKQYQELKTWWQVNYQGVAGESDKKVVVSLDGHDVDFGYCHLKMSTL